MRTQYDRIYNSFVYYVRFTTSDSPPKWLRRRTRNFTLVIEVGDDGMMNREVILNDEGRPTERNTVRGWTEMCQFHVDDLANGIAPAGGKMIDADEFEMYWSTALVEAEWRRSIWDELRLRALHLGVLVCLLGGAASAAATIHLLSTYDLFAKNPAFRLPTFIYFAGPLLLIAAGIIWLRRLPTAPALQSCPRCGYDLRGHREQEVKVRCPECGQKQPKSSERPAPHEIALAPGAALIVVGLLWFTWVLVN